MEQGAPAHVSIGEVLGRLRDEFPDITISKIRFLESQGLVNPERTPSGYRKFYPDDIERLRWILHRQKEHFLPLKVIKEQIDDIDAAGGFGAGAVEIAAEPGAPPEALGTTPGSARSRAGASGDGSRRKVRRGSTRLDAALEEEAREVGSHVETGGVSLTRAELAAAAGLSDTELAELEEYGLVTPTFAGRDRALFDEHALAVARLAAGFRQYGIEPRHLRMYRAFADREATLFQQVLLQYRRQRNPDAAGRADEAWSDLARLGRQMRRVLLEQRR